MTRVSTRRPSRAVLLTSAVIVAAMLVAMVWLLRTDAADDTLADGQRPGAEAGVAHGMPELPAPATGERATLPSSPPAAVDASATDGALDDGLPDYPRGVVRGRLVPVDGGPLPPGLKVAASLRQPFPRIRHLTVTSSEQRDNLPDPHKIGSDRLRRVTATTVADDGSFELADVPTTGAWLAVDDDRLYPAQPVLLSPTASDGAADDDGPGDEELVVPLVRGARILGRVQTSEGKAPPGTELDGGSTIDPFAIFDQGMSIIRLGPTVTDATGHFLLGPVPVAQTVRVTAQRPEYEIAVAEVPPLASGADHEVALTLVRGASLAGHVLDAADQPVAAARVMLLPTEMSMTDFDIMGKLLEIDVTTDEQGAFRFDSLSAGGWRVRLAAAGFRSVSTEPTELASSQVVEGLLLRAERGLSLSGRVVDPDGAPIAEAEVEAALPPSMVSMQANMDRQYRQPTHTDDDGRFTVTGYDEGKLRVWVKAEGFVPDHVDAIAGDDDLLISLGRKTSLSGIAIRLDDAEPLTDYHLTFLPSEGLFDLTKMFEMDQRMRNLPRPVHVRDDEGRFLAEQVTPGTYDITLRAEGYAETVLADVPAVADELTTGLVFLVPEEARLTGLVVSARDGQPVAGAKLATGRSDMLSRMSNALTGQGASAVTDVDGRFTLGGLGSAPVSLTVSHANHIDLGLKQVQPRPGEEHDLGVITLPTGAAVWGVVRDGERHPVPNVSVMVSDNTGTTFKRAKSNVEGGYRVDGLRAGTYNIMRMDFSLDADSDSATSYLDSMVMRSVTLAENEEQRVDLEPDAPGGVRLEGTIRSGGMPEADAMVWVVAEEGGGGLHMTSSDEDGHYSIGSLEPGAYLVQVLPSGAMSLGSGSQPVAPVVSTVRVGDGPVTRHDVDVPGGVLRGQVVDERTRQGAGGVRVVLERTDDGLPVSRILAATGGRVGELYSDADGSFRFVHLASGTYDVLAGGSNILGFGEAGWAATRVEGVSVHETRPSAKLEIELRPGGGITGTITDEDGEPLAGIPVWARDDSSGQWLSLIAEVSSDNSGSYTVNSLEPGPWTLAFGGRRAALTIGPTRSVSRGHLADLDMALERGVEVWVETGEFDPKDLSAQVATAGGSLPLHLTSIDQIMGYQPVPSRLKLGRVARGSYDVTVVQGTELLLQKTIHVSGREPTLVLTLEP